MQGVTGQSVRARNDCDAGASPCQRTLGCSSELLHGPDLLLAGEQLLEFRIVADRVPYGIDFEALQRDRRACRNSQQSAKRFHSLLRFARASLDFPPAQPQRLDPSKRLSRWVTTRSFGGRRGEHQRPVPARGKPSEVGLGRQRHRHVRAAALRARRALLRQRAWRPLHPQPTHKSRRGQRRSARPLSSPRSPSPPP